MKNFTLVNLILILVSVLLSCGKSPSKNPVEEFHNYINKLSEEKSTGVMYLEKSELWRGEKNKFFYPFSSNINAEDLIIHTDETLELKNMGEGYKGYGKIWYHMGIFKTEEYAKKAENILINRIRPSGREGHMKVVGEIYRNGRKIFFILVGRDIDKKLVSPDIRSKGKELIGLK
jgi:hypothetical protein